MKVTLTIIVFLFIKTISAQQYYNVIKYGAKNDSSKLCTTAIAKAIDAASKTGGGTIYF
ncbi:MAG: glycosyl hydrolase family 28-related protein, partial [Ferruginibacter sp.]